MSVTLKAVLNNKISNNEIRTALDSDKSLRQLKFLLAKAQKYSGQYDKMSECELEDQIEAAEKWYEKFVTIKHTEF